MTYMTIKRGKPKATMPSTLYRDRDNTLTCPGFGYMTGSQRAQKTTTQTPWLELR